MKRHLLASMCLVLATGCTSNDQPDIPNGIVVVGKIVRSGKPLELKNANIGVETIELAVVPLNTTNPGAGTEYAMAAADGSFRIEGPGRGVSPGKYRLAVFYRNDGVSSDGLNGAFSETSSPIEFDVPEDEMGGEVDLEEIDLDNYQQASSDDVNSEANAESN